MSVHTMTTTVKLASKVLVHASPGERPAKVIDLAIEEIKQVREKLGLHPPFAEMHVGMPQYQDNRRWLVIVSTMSTATSLVEA